MNRLQEILDLLADATNLSDEEVGELESELLSIVDAIMDGDFEIEVSAEGDREPTESEVANARIELLEQVVDHIDGLRSVAGERWATAEEVRVAEEAEAEERQRRMDELERRLSSDNADGEDGDGDGDGDGEGAGDGDGGGDSAESGDGDGDAGGDNADSDAESGDREPVLADAGGGSAGGSAPARARPRAADMQRHQRPRNRAERRSAARQQRVSIRSTGFRGGEFENVAAVDHAVQESLVRLSRSGGGGNPDGQFPVATFVRERDTIPERERLATGRVTDVSDMADEVRSAVFNPPQMEAMLADAGLCAPIEPRYDLPNIAQSGRPLRDQFTVTFNAGRGGIRFMEPMSLGSIGTSGGSPDQAIGVTTAESIADGSADKPHQRLECGDEQEHIVDAISLQLEIDNFTARTYGERVQNFTDITAAAHARFAERRLLDQMKANSTQLFGAQQYGATRDLLTDINRTAVWARSFYRMPDNAPIDVALPGWVGMGLLPDDQVNALQTNDQQYSVTAAWVTSRLAERNIRVAWYGDDFLDQLVPGGPTPSYPTTFTAILAHPGAHVYVDNGELDLGVVRDKDLVKANVYRTFMEEFWTSAMWGVFSLAIDYSLCASGASAGSIEPKCGS